MGIHLVNFLKVKINHHYYFFNYLLIFYFHYLSCISHFSGFSSVIVWKINWVTYWVTTSCLFMLITKWEAPHINLVDGLHLVGPMFPQHVFVKVVFKQMIIIFVLSKQMLVWLNSWCSMFSYLWTRHKKTFSHKLIICANLCAQNTYCWPQFSILKVTY